MSLQAEVTMGSLLSLYIMKQATPWWLHKQHLACHSEVKPPKDHLFHLQQLSSTTLVCLSMYCRGSLPGVPVPLLVILQAKARELFGMAVKQGHFRNEQLSVDGSRGELNLHALTAGVAMLSLHNWLQDIQ